MYIRQARYHSDLWNLAAGTIDSNFVSYVDVHDPNLAVIFDGYRGQNGCSAADSIFDDSGSSIDFYHLCASLDAKIYSNLYTDLIVSTADKQLSAWGMDLVTLASNVLSYLNETAVDPPYSYETIYNCTLYFLENNIASNFEQDDLLADIDATNLYIMMAVVDNEALDFPIPFDEYYDEVSQRRMSVFVRMSSKAALFTAATLYLHLASGYDPIAEAIDLPMADDIVSLHLYQCMAMGDAFVDYIWEVAENENA